MSVSNSKFQCMCGIPGCVGPHMCKCGPDCGCEEKVKDTVNYEEEWPDGGIENFAVYR